MAQDWKTVWSKKASDGPIDLAQLIRLDGFDSGAGRIEVGDWQCNCDHIGRKLGISDGESLFEVGCGAGAFLFGLRRTWQLRVGGLDYSQSLISVARVAMPDGSFETADAREMPAAPEYDYVLCNSIFQYLDLQGAAEVFDRMIQKARIAVAILEVPDLATREAAENVRRAALGAEEYEEKYRGLEHAYYPRDWFAQRASNFGLSAELFDTSVPNYSQNAFRFGVIIRK